MTYAIEWQLFGDRPWVFHLINILLYAADCALVAGLARRLGGITIAYFAGLLFAVHPVHVEAVAGLVGRAELLSTGAMLGVMILALERLTPTRIGAIALLFVVGLLCKEQAILLPIFVMGILGLRKGEEHAPQSGRVNENQARKILLLVLCWTDAAYLILREYSRMKLSWDPGLLDWTMQPLIRAVGINRWLVPFSVLGHYTMLMFVPYKQSIDYGYAVTNFAQQFNDPFLWLGFAAALVGITALALSLIKRSWLAFWCLLGIALSYGMVSNFTSLIGTIMGERLLFLPSVFFCILVGWIVWQSKSRWLLRLLSIAIVLGAARTTVYASQWLNRLQFYQRQTASNPRSERTWWLLAGELDREGRYAEAMAADQKMREIDPNYWVGWYYAAQIALDQHQYAQAWAYLDRAWNCNPAGTLEITLLRQKIRDSGGLQQEKIRHNAPSTNS
jgi:tetratricopeptide (TPR) repeat protein